MDPASAGASPQPAEIAFVERLLRQVPLFRVLVRAAECRLFSTLDLPPPVLDIGCGDGTFVQALAPSATWVGIDPSSRSVKVAKGLGAYRLLAIADGRRLPFRDGAFRTVVANSTLEHIHDVDHVLEEACRVLRPGGVCVVTVPSDLFYDYYFGTIAMSRLAIRPLARAYRRWVRWVARVHYADRRRSGVSGCSG